LFNLFGTAYILPLVALGLYQKFIFYIVPGELTAANVMIYIAVAHSAFNIINTLILLPATKLLEKAAILITPKGKREINGSPVYLDRRLLDSPAAALFQARKELLRMAQMARDALEMSFNAFINKESKDFKRLGELEDAIDNLQEEITGYLVEISQQKLNDEQSDELPVWLHSVNDLERIGDHTENLVELTQRAIRLNTKLTEEARQELLAIYSDIMEMGDLIILAIMDNDRSKGYKALSREDNINRLYIEFRDSQIQRLNAGVCTAYDGIIFIDVLNNLEKIGDHLTNIAQAVLHEFQFGHGEPDLPKHHHKAG
jgi:phosphate:Na+ symporter